jgi:MraZ protein
VGKYFGTYSRTLDSKNRLLIPGKLVREMPSRFYVLRGFEGCLSVYEEGEFNTLLEKLQTLPYLQQDARTYIRIATSSASELDVDSHGRLALSKELSEAYHIGKDVTIIGVLDHFEIWDAPTYAKWQSEHSSDYEALASRSAQ